MKEIEEEREVYGIIEEEMEREGEQSRRVH